MEVLYLVSIWIYAAVSIWILIYVFNSAGDRRRYLRAGLRLLSLHFGYQFLWLLLENRGLDTPLLPGGLILYPLLLYLLSHFCQQDNRRLLRVARFLLPVPYLFRVGFFIWSACFSPDWPGAELYTEYLKAYYFASMLLTLTAGILMVRLSQGTREASPSLDLLARQLSVLFFGLSVLNSLLCYETEKGVQLTDFDLRYLVFLFLGLAALLIFLNGFSGKTPHFPGASELPEPEIPEPRQGSTGIPEAELARLAGLVENTLVDQKLFLSPTLSLERLARQTGIPKHQLTQVFTLYYHQSFYQLISSHRISYAVSRIEQSGNALTLETLSEECGFNSKTSFNRYFKEYTGRTPSEFRKLCAGSSQLTNTLSPA